MTAIQVLAVVLMGLGLHHYLGPLDPPVKKQLHAVIVLLLGVLLFLAYTYM
jgi:hypothetical protein